MKNYTITVNGNVYDVTVEENGAGAPVPAGTGGSAKSGGSAKGSPGSAKGCGSCRSRFY